MSDVTIYHNPRCTKSRRTLQLLESKGIEPSVIEYLKTPPSQAHLRRIVKLLDIEPRDLIRRKEALYKELNPEKRDLSAAEAIRLMVENPKLIERPIVLANGKAAIGRPPENVEEIL